MTLKVHLWPHFNTPDAGDGGVRRVVEAQERWLPAQGIELVQDANAADVIASHILFPKEYLRHHAGKALVSMCHGLYWSEYVREDGSSMWPDWCHETNADVLRAILAADITTSPSEWVSQCIRRHTARDVRTIYHGVDLAEWSRETYGHRSVEPSGGYVLWNKTRPDPVCDPTPAVQLAGLMPTVPFRVTFTWGDQATYPPNLTVTGKLPYEQAKAEVMGAGAYLCTTRETFGIGTLEALAAGVPVVGFKWGGQAEFIENGRDGWLVTPGDFDGLVRATTWALQARSNPAVQAACREKAMAFNWPNAAAQYADVFREAHERNRSGGPRVSIVVPAYNAEQWLDDALDSVQAQTIGADVECIVVDDGSTDGTAAIADARAAAAPNVRVIRLEENLGVATARNVGIAAARGRYVMQLDADDRLTPDASAILAAALDADRSIHVAYGGVEFRDERLVTPIDYGKGQPGYSGWPVDFRFDQQIGPPPGRLGRPQNLIPYNAMVRRPALDAVGRYRWRRRNAEDPDLWCRLASYGFAPKMVTTKPLLLYRVREGSLSTSTPVDDWSRWFPWSRMLETTPAGALRGARVAVPSLQPVAVTVVIPVGRGHERLLQDAVDSVDAQTFRAFEVIVVNDTGGALPPLPSWVVVLETEGQRGPAHCRNLALAMASGRTFLCLDADDYLEPHALRVMFDEHLRTGDIIFSDFWEDPEEPGRFRRYETLNWEPKNLWETGLVGGAVTQLIPTSAARAVGGFDEALPAWEDWDFHLKLCEAGYCSRRVPTTLWTYRKHTGQRREAAEAARDLPGGAKEAIVRRWPGLFPNTARDLGIAPGDGARERNVLMGCRGCGQRTTGPAPISNAARMAEQNQAAAGTMLLVEYTSQQAGGREFQPRDPGCSGAIYTFSAGDPPTFVHPEDVRWFQKFPDLFRVLEGVPAVEGEPSPHAPTLQAAGAPPLEVDAMLVVSPPPPKPERRPEDAVPVAADVPVTAAAAQDKAVENLSRARQRATARSRGGGAAAPVEGAPPVDAGPPPDVEITPALGSFVSGEAVPDLSAPVQNPAVSEDDAE